MRRFYWHEIVPATFLTNLYLSGSNSFTLGIGDVIPISTLARVITICEAGTGVGADFARQPRSAVWARITSSDRASAEPAQASHEHDGQHL